MLRHAPHRHAFPTRLSPIGCHLRPEPRHARSDQDRVIVQRRSDEALDEPMGGSMCSVWRLLRRVREHAGGGPLVEITMADLPGAASDANAGSAEYETSASPGSAGSSRRTSARVMSSTSGWCIRLVPVRWKRTSWRAHATRRPTRSR